MKCVICRHGETKSGKVTVTLERNGTTLVIKGVLTSVSGNCGDEYLSEETTTRLLETAEDAAREKVLVDVRQYVAA